MLMRQQSVPSEVPFRQAILHEYHRRCLETNQGDPHYLGSNPSATLRSYQESFGDQLGLYERSVSFAKVMDAARASVVVYVGDFHPLRLAKDTFVRIVEEGAAPRRQRVVLLEEFQANDNRYLKAYHNDVIDDNGLRSKAWSHNLNGSWGGVLGIVRYAKKKGIPVRGIDQRLPSLRLRTSGIADQVEQYVTPKSQVFVLAGQFHLTPNRIPAQLDGIVKSSITVFQAPDEMFWQLLARGLAYETEAVQTSSGVYCLNNSNPLFLHMVQQNAALDRAERLGKEELDDNYLDSLIGVLSTVLGISGAAIDLGTPGLLSTLERLVYGNVEREEAVKVFEGLVPTD